MLNGSIRCFRAFVYFLRLKEGLLYFNLDNNKRSLSMCFCSSKVGAYYKNAYMFNLFILMVVLGYEIGC